MNFKHMLFRATSALLFMSGIGLAGCNETEPDAFLTVTQQEIEVEYTGLTVEGEMVNFELGTNRSWQATYVEEWIHLTHSEGDRGRVRILLDIDENNTGKDRTGFIIFEGEGGTRRTIAVTQKLKVDALSVSPTEITVVKSGLLETGEKAEIYLSTNSDWTITVADDSKWITPAATSGEAGDMSIELTVELNKTGGERTGSFVINAGSKSETVTVIQNLEGLKLSADNFRVNKFGFSDEAQTPLTFTITSAEAWTSACDDWLSIEPASGEAGETEVTLLVDENTSGAPREGAVKITTSLNGLEATITVSQNTKTNIYDDDGKAVGYVYYNEPFDWAIPFGMDDQVGLDGTKWTRLSVQANDEIKAAWAACGLEDLNPGANCLYIASDYLHMGAKNKQTGVILPAIDVPAGQCTDVELAFETCANIGGSGNPDAITVTVEILKGPGTVNGDSEKLSAPMTPDPVWGWTPMSVTCYGITADTRIVIRSTQQDASGYFRWFLNDIKMTKTAVE